METGHQPAGLPSSREKRGPSFLPWLVLAGILVFLFLRGGRKGPTFDFRTYYGAGEAVAEGRPLYQGAAPGKEYYLYSPAFALLCRPLAFLAPKEAYTLFHLFSLGAFLLSVLSLGRVFSRRSGGPGLTWADAGAALFVIYPLASNFKHGNSNTLVLFLLCLSLWAWTLGWRFLGGLPLSLAVGVKVTPILFLPWLVLRKRWVEAAGFLAGLVLWMVLFPAFLLGPSRAFRETRAWLERIVLPAAFSRERTRPKVLEESGESLPRIAVAVLARPGGGEAEGRKKSPTPSLGILSRKEAKILGYGIALLVVLATLLLTRREPGPGKGGFGLLAAAALLASPVSRAAHFVLLLPLAAWLFHLALYGREENGKEQKRRTAGGARPALAAGVLFMAGSILAAKATGLPSKAFFPDACLAFPLWLGGLLLVPGGKA